MVKSRGRVVWKRVRDGIQPRARKQIYTIRGDKTGIERQTKEGNKDVGWGGGISGDRALNGFVLRFFGQSP